jgi:multidrug efflux pump subunit AcrB
MQKEESVRQKVFGSNKLIFFQLCNAGLSPEDLEQRITGPYERVLTTTVDNIEHIESQSLYGITVVKIFLQPRANVPTGIAQVTSVSQTILRQLPPGTTPPLVLSYSASNVPVVRVELSGKNLSEQQLNDYALNFVQTQLITVPGGDTATNGMTHIGIQWQVDGKNVDWMERSTTNNTKSNRIGA